VARRWRHNPYSTSHPVEEVVQTSVPTSGVAKMAKKSLASKIERQIMMEQLGMGVSSSLLSSSSSLGSDSEDHHQRLHEEEDVRSQMSGDAACCGHSDDAEEIYLAE